MIADDLVHETLKADIALAFSKLQAAVDVQATRAALVEEQAARRASRARSKTVVKEMSR